LTAGREWVPDWIDGFLFVANQPILDLLNTKPVLEGIATELLVDSRALERWLIASRLVTPAEERAKLRVWRNSGELDAFLRDLIVFREKFRDAVVRLESGSRPREPFLSDLNRLLRQYPQRISLQMKSGKVAKENVVTLASPADLWTRIVYAAADLLADADFSRIRKCESCVLHFLDTSKKGSRRWCSMSICGNKWKVAAYQKRKREADAL
jgi:predicted RNA-binding Zn ribbon-like protein